MSNLAAAVFIFGACTQGVGTDYGGGGASEGQSGSDTSAPDTQVPPAAGGAEADGADVGVKQGLPQSALADGSALQFESESAPTNVLMISIDTLRRDFVGRYATADDAAHLTPTLDQLLDEGVALDDHWSCANWTYSGVLCALSGQYNADMGYVPALGDIGEADMEPIDEDTQLLGGILMSNGFEAGLISTSPFINVSFGFGHQYDTLLSNVEWRADEVVDEGLALLDEMKVGGDPWFLHLHFIDPHAPYDPPDSYIPSQFDGGVMGYDLTTTVDVQESNVHFPLMDEDDQARMKEYARALYAGEVAFTDDQIARLMDTLEARGDLEDTLVVVWSDHGEQLWDRGELEHGDQLHAEEAAAIAIFWAKDLEPGQITTPTSHRDLVPTLLSVLGIADARPWTGRALTADAPAAPIFAARVRGDETRQALDIDGERLLYEWDGALEYYDTYEDPDELDDLLPDYNRAQELWEVLKPEVVKLDDAYDGAEHEEPIFEVRLR